MIRLFESKDDCGASESPAASPVPAPQLTPGDYEAGLARLHIELAKLQHWVVETGAKICVLFEGRPGAGKRDIIKAITEHATRRVFQVVTLPEPTAREKSQMCLQRYIPHLPAAGEVVIFDGTWYGRAGIERALGQCTAEEASKVLATVPLVERAIVDSGVRLLKYWLEVTQVELARRLRQRIADPRVICTDYDLSSFRRWFEFSRARDALLAATDTDYAPWFVARSDDARRTRLNVISHLLSAVPYEGAPRTRPRLPASPEPDGYSEPQYAYRYVEERY